jgi:hypothetical protein
MVHRRTVSTHVDQNGSTITGDVAHAERLIEALLVLARNDQARALTDPLAEDALEGRTARGITTVTTLGRAPVTGDAVLLERLVNNLLDNAERYKRRRRHHRDLDRHPRCDLRPARGQHRRRHPRRHGRTPVPAVHPTGQPQTP